MNRLQFKYSYAVAALPAVAILIVLHVALRSTAWRAEWLWTFESYNFVVMLIVPVVAGIGAWEGARWASAEPQIAAAGGQSRVLVSIFAATFWISVSIYLVGLLVVIAMAGFGTAPGLPSVRVLMTVVPTVGLLGLFLAIGLGIGWATKKMLYAPLVAVFTFAFLIFGYVAIPGLFVEVGGATASLIGLRPRIPVQLAQIGFYSAAGIVAMLTALGARSGERRTALIAVTAVAVVLAVVIISLGGRRFDVAEVMVECDQSPTPICLDAGYEHLREPLHAQLDSAVGVLTETGLAAPSRFTQDPNDNQPGVALLPTSISDDETIVSLLVQGLVPRSCDIFRDEETFTSYNGINYWLLSLVSDAPFDPTVPDQVQQGDTPEARLWVQQASADLSTCQS